MKTIFISRNKEDVEALSSFCKERNWRLIAQSLIDFKQVDAIFPSKPTDVVFFTSPRSVQFFFNQKSIHKNQKIACIGQKTAEFVQKMGFLVDFYAKNDKIPTLAAEEFKSWIGEQTVLFPLSNRSNKSMQKVLKSTKIFEVIVYETILKNIRIQEDIDVFVFSSPSNVEAFLLQNKFYLEPKILAWGETTQHFLANLGHQSNYYYNPSSLL